MSAIGGVIVAGGRGQRMGRPKGLLEVAGEPALLRLVAVFREARLDPIVAVVGIETRGLADALAGLVVVGSDPDADMIDSVARGLACMPGTSRGAVVQPVDAPFTTPEMIAALGAGERPRILCHRGAPGHPVMLPSRFFSRVIERPDGGLRALLAEAEVELVEWPDRRVLADLDTPDDLVAWGLVRH